MAARSQRHRPRAQPGPHSACQASLPAQRDGNRTIAFPGTQTQSDQSPAFLLKHEGGVWANG
jgi:hypothetical protein